jgi:hypothetical protein
MLPGHGLEKLSKIYLKQKCWSYDLSGRVQALSSNPRTTKKFTKPGIKGDFCKPVKVKDKTRSSAPISSPWHGTAGARKGIGARKRSKRPSEWGGGATASVCR